MGTDPARPREPGTIADAWTCEAESLMLVGRPFDGFVEYTKRVSSTYLVHMDRNRYNVPAFFANRPVSLRVYCDRLVAVAEGLIICEHQRIIDQTHSGPGRTLYDCRHYLAVIQRKPGALRNGAPFLELPDAFKRLQHYLLRQPDRIPTMFHDLTANLKWRPRSVRALISPLTHQTVNPPTLGAGFVASTPQAA